MNKIFPEEADLLIEKAKKVGPETLKFTEWYIDQVNNHGLEGMSITTKASMDSFFKIDDLEQMSDVSTDDLLEIEEVCKELNAMHSAPTLSLSEWSDEELFS